MIARNARDGRLGIRQVGTPAEDIPEGAYLHLYKQRYAGRLVRVHVPNLPRGAFVGENTVPSDPGGRIRNVEGSVLLDGVFAEIITLGVSAALRVRELNQKPDL